MNIKNKKWSLNIGKMNVISHIEQEKKFLISYACVNLIYVF